MIINNQYIITVNLFGKHKFFSLDTLGDDMPVFLDIVYIIADAETDIQAFVRPAAISSVSRKNRVVNIGKFSKVEKLIKVSPVFVF